MVLLVIFSFFALVASGVVLVMFPEFRLRLFASIDSVLGEANRQFAQSARMGAAGMEKSGGALRRSLVQSVGFLLANRRLSAAALLLVVTPPLLALLAGGPSLFAFEEDEFAPDPQILTLLDGEHLAPPPALPPEFFTTREVELFRPDIVHADRNWALLNPEFSQRLLLVMKTLRERHGYELVLIEGYRSPERQAQLAAMGEHVTKAGAYKSYHQYGLAADCAFLRDGRIVISERDPWAMRGYQLYGEVAEMYGMRWGGRWQMQDYGHMELRVKNGPGLSAS